jgi:flagellar biosynthesis GTPase FlhF
MSVVSPAPGHEPFALVSGVTATEAPSAHRSNTRPALYSQYRGPFVFNETEEERLKREKEEEDKKKQTNFDKVREKAEREEAARKEAEARAAEAERKLREREEADKKAAEAKLAAEKRFQELAQQKEVEAKQKADEAEAERKKREEVEKELAEFKKAQEEELNALLNEIPQDKRPPLDDSMTVPQKLKIVKHTMEMLGTPKPPVGHPQNKQGDKTTRKAELLKKGFNNLTSDEALELAGLTGD